MFHLILRALPLLVVLPSSEFCNVKANNGRVSYVSLQAKFSGRKPEVAAELGLKNDVPKDISGGCCMSIETNEGDARRTEAS
jgi:hypothetical protein